MPDAAAAPTPVREIGLVTARNHLRRRVTDALVAEIRAGLAETLTPASRGAVVLDPLSEPQGSAS